MTALLIYTDQSSKRINYVLDVMLVELLGLSYTLTDDLAGFTAHTGVKFAYATQPIDGVLYFELTPIMYERGIRKEYHPAGLDIIVHEQLTGFFKVSQESVFPFDPFASAFYMLTRYEEYLLAQTDKHGRFHPSLSVQDRAGILEHPMVNYYVLAIEVLLQKRYPNLTTIKPKFKYLSTIDVDMSYSYLHKGFWRNVGALFKEIRQLKWKDIILHLAVLMRVQRDPFDTFDYLREVAAQYKHDHLFFFLMGDYSEHDKNISYTNKTFRKLVVAIANQFPIGIHLSYNSHYRKKGYTTEMTRLKEVANVDVTRNRFHFLKFKIPDTFSEASFAGIREDYSLGYASKPGFRAGICHPYTLFDLTTDRIKEIDVFPFVYMDATMLFYKNLPPVGAEEEIRILMERAAAVGGLFISIWHNNSLSEQNEWHGWRQVYEYTHQLATTLSPQHGKQYTIPTAPRT